MDLLQQPLQNARQLCSAGMKLYKAGLKPLMLLLLASCVIYSLNIYVTAYPLLSLILALVSFYCFVVVLSGLGAIVNRESLQLGQRIKSLLMPFIYNIFSVIVITLLYLAIALALGLIFFIAGAIVTAVLHLFVAGNSTVFTIIYGFYATLFGIAATVVFVYVSLPFYLVTPLIIVEKRGPIEALKDSFALAKGNRWLILRTYLLAFVMISVVQIFAFIISIIIIKAMGLDLNMAAQQVSHNHIKSSQLPYIALLPSLIALYFFVMPLFSAVLVLLTKKLILLKQNMAKE